MKPRDVATPFVLLLLAALTIVYAYFFDGDAASEGSRSDGASDVFPNFRVDEVTRVELVHGGETLLLGKDDLDRWELLSPTRARANSAAVDVLLREIDLATRVRAVRQSDAVGLDKPRVVGSVTVGKTNMVGHGAEYRFALGGDSPRPEGAAYFRLEGHGTFVVNRSLKVQLLRGADAYRDRTLAPMAASDVARIEVQSPGAPRVVLDEANPEFRIAATGLRASRSAVDRLVSAITEARVESFTQARRTTDPGTTTVTLIPREPKRDSVVLQIGGPCPDRPDGIFVERWGPDPMAGCMPASWLSAVETPATGLSDASVFFARSDEIEELRLETLGAPQRTVDIARRDRTWREREPADHELTADESASASELVAALASSTAIDVQPAAKGEPFSPRIRATVVRTGGGQTEIVDLSGLRADGTMRARRLDDGAWLTLALETARRFEPHAVVLRGLSAWHEPLRASSIVGIDDRCGSQAQRLERVEGGWSMRSPPGMQAGSTLVEGLLEELARAKAESWVAEHDDGTFGLGGPRACTVGLSVEHGNSSIRQTSLMFGADAPQGVYARCGDDPAVFVMGRPLRDAFSVPLLDASALHIDPDIAMSIRATRRGERVVYDRVHDRFVARGLGPAGDAAPNLDGEPFERAVAALRPVAASHFGAPSSNEGFDTPTLEIDVTPRHDAGPRGEIHIAFGGKARYRDIDSYFTRTPTVDATFVVPAGQVDAVLELLRAIPNPSRLGERDSELPR